MATTATDTGINKVWAFFKTAYTDNEHKILTLRDFSAEWKEMTDADKAQIREGIQNGSLTY
jgi:hypothetical protein